MGKNGFVIETVKRTDDLWLWKKRVLPQHPCVKGSYWGLYFPVCTAKRLVMKETGMVGSASWLRDYSCSLGCWIYNTSQPKSLPPPVVAEHGIFSFSSS